jgi:hypothetical protein
MGGDEISMGVFEAPLGVSVSDVFWTIPVLNSCLEITTTM